ncbi:hypothetical protein HYALB_00008101 [Hymenoscyphus albidus]|uniref:Uncharacterized protein n=1 Tax=Hymenoscyphus albidus TaxID=595503 RepID=A0A9N9LWX1_9HELO|nr:hypothetical protein HYALB_00008101 [Hymenoscyphus albidus]
MRYQNWDVLLFPEQSKIPQQEFKTACQVIQDHDAQTLQTNPSLLPTVTSFIPALPPGAHFRVSIHSWENPEISRFIQSIKKSTDKIMFEARVFLDGRIAGSKWFSQDGPWPTILELSIDLDKHGEYEKLKFPAFHQELLSQSYWNACDDYGRVKIIIAEGFTRDNMTYPFERVKNLTSAIAWPNAAMWRQVPVVGPYYAPHFASQQAEEDTEAHSHSPRRAIMAARPPLATCNMESLYNQPVYLRPSMLDPFTEPSFSGWRQSSVRQSSATDVSMPDYTKPNTRTGSVRHFTDPMSVSDKPDRRFESLQMPGAYETICEALMPRVPVNTPQNGEPTPGRKEKMQESPRGVEQPIIGNENAAGAARKVSQPFSIANHGTNKRQRVVTPAASKVIDDEDEPRSSPAFRKTSGISSKSEPPPPPPHREPHREGDVRILSGNQNIR